MDDDLQNNPGNEQQNTIGDNLENNAVNNPAGNPENSSNDLNANQPQNNMNTAQNNDNSVNRLSMDRNGNIHTDKGGTAAIAQTSKTFVILGWISAALAAFISPLFAIAGIVFGVLLNRQAKGRGTPIIIVNVVVAAISIVFGLFLVAGMRRMLGY